MKCPLTGLDCNKLKNIPIVEKTEDVTKIIYLCNDCADIYILNQETQKTIEEINKENAENVLKKLVEIGMEFMPVINCCSFCGATSSDINKTGRLGCMHCYDHFGPEIMSSIQNYHGETKHVGKIPKKWKLQQEEIKRNEIRKNFTIEAYIKQIEEITKIAIKNEQYEIASISRDKLKEILKLQIQYRNLEKKFSETNDEELASEIKNQIKQIENQCFIDWSQSTS